MNSKICPKCGTENPLNASYCINCGNYIKDVEERPLQASDETLHFDSTIRHSSDTSQKATEFSLSYFRGYKIIKQFPAHGAEADTFLVEKNNRDFFLKLYRPGMEPKIDVLQKIKQISSKLKDHVVEVYEVGLDE